MNAVAEKQTQDQVNQTETVEASRGYVTPGVNILETTEAYVLEAEMPGVTKEGLDLKVENNVLTIIGRRPAAPEGKLLYRESTSADYRRVFALESSVEAARISAKIDQGILSITLPKAEKARPHRITVN